MGEQKKAPRSSTLDRWGILNPWGDVWTVDTFNDPDDAQRHLEAFWRGNPNAGDLSRFKVALVRVRVSVPFELREKRAALNPLPNPVGGGD